MTQKTDQCDLCGSDALVITYDVADSARGLKVYVCANCGLVQSLPRIDHMPRRSGFPASGAGFGNIRYGKGFRTDHALEIIQQHIDLPSISRIMDVGANRGSFIEAIQPLCPTAHIDAVEPDERVIGAYNGRDGITVINKRIEHCDLPDSTYDLVYHSHTLEHEAHPLASLKRVAASMVEGGYLMLEVPNIEQIRTPNYIEEWFIDKHLYHYSDASLKASLAASGFEIVHDTDPKDDFYLTLLLRKNSKLPKPILPDEAAWATELLATYASNMARNHANLRKAANHLSTKCQTQKVVIWGAGRIFTSFVDIGGFDPKLLAGLIDKKLHVHVPTMYSIAVQPPTAIETIAPDVVFIASRLYLNEIKAETSDLYDGTPTILSLDDLLEYSPD